MFQEDPNVLTHLYMSEFLSASIYRHVCTHILRGKDWRRERDRNLEDGRQQEGRGRGGDQAWDLFSGTGSCLDLI